MKKSYRVLTNGKVLLKNVKANSMEEVGLLVAVEFGDKYFGCNVIQNPPFGEHGADFMCVAVKEYYEGDSAVEVASKAMANATRFANQMYMKTYDFREESINYSYPPLKSYYVKEA